MRISFILVLIMLLQFNLYSNDDTSKVVITETKFGDYYISNHAFVHGNILRVKYPASRQFDYPESDSMVAIRDSRGAVLFTDHVDIDGLSEVSIFVDTMRFCGVGTLIAYNYDVEPNYGNCTNTIQFLGFNKLGKFVPFTDFISVCYDMKPQIKWIKTKSKRSKDVREYDCPSEKERRIPYLVVQRETEFCHVTIFDYYRMALNGLKKNKAYSAEKMDRQPIFLNNMQTETLEYDDSTRLSIKLDLYVKPKLSSSKKKVYFRESNQITLHYYMQAKSNGWIFVAINGVEGFMLFGDLEKLGLAKCD